MSIMPGSFTNPRRRNFYDPFVRDTQEPFRYYNHGSAVAAPFPHPYAPPYHHHQQQHEYHQQANESFSSARIEWKETADAYFIKTELPGIRREDVKVEIEDDKLLKISGQRVSEYEDKHNNWNHVERSRGKFMTAFMLPEDSSSAEQVRSTMENGVLTITVPKRNAKHHVRPVEIVV